MLREELKKIWRPGMLVVLLLLGFVFYNMYLSFYIKYFPNGPQLAGELQVAKEWVAEYGTTLESEEIDDIKAGLPALYAEADAYVANFSRSRQYGIDSYEAFRSFYSDSVLGVSGELSEDQQTRYEDARIIGNYLQSDDTNNIDGRIYATTLYLDQYEIEKTYGINMVTRAYDEGYSEKEYAHAANTFYGEDEAWRNILPLEVPEATSTYFGYLLIWMVLSVCLLLSPILVRDRMRYMRSLQWCSRKGRGILFTQLGAAMLSAFLLATLNLLIFGGLFAANETRVFFNSRMYSFMLFTSFSWVNWTHGIWCIAVIIMCYVVSMGIGALAFFLSRYSGNYVAMLLKLIPLFIVAAFICPRLIEYVFYYRNSIYQATGIPGIEAMLAMFLFLIGTMLCFAACMRQKKRELLDA